jgi:hypothetical protein
MKLEISAKFKPQDIWIGVYWKLEVQLKGYDGLENNQLTIFICILPMLPIRLWFGWHPKQKITPSHLTTDPTDPRLGHSVDETPTPQQEVYLVLSEEERKKGFVRPYRDSYVHKLCGTETTMGRVLSETYARDPDFYGATYCVHCAMHRPVSEFVWSADGQQVGS